LIAAIGGVQVVGKAGDEDFPECQALKEKHPILFLT
jgi:hypothetical protein